MSIDNGGPAFPVAGTEDRNGNVTYGTEGMTLRDFFAAKAMQGDWAAQSEHMGEFLNADNQKVFENRAATYYRAADAMLKARGES